MIGKLNNRLQPIGSPADGQDMKSFVPWKFGNAQGLQTRNVSTSNNAITKFQQQGQGGYAFGTVGNGGTLYLTSTLTPKPPHRANPMFALAHAVISLGTSATFNGQIYPTIGTAVGTQFPLQGGLDFMTFDGTQPTWVGYVTNNSGAAATIGFNVIWQYMWFNNGSAS